MICLTTQCGGNLSIRAANSKDRLLGFKTQFQLFNQETFQWFLSKVVAVLEDSSHHDKMDNVCFHKTMV